MKKYLIFFFVLCSCVSQTDFNDELKSIENLMGNHPDSSLLRIKEIDRLSLKKEKDIAYYSLLYSIILDKNYIDSNNDSLIKHAVKYYDLYGSSEEKAAVHFYRGRIFHNAKEYDTALENYLEAEQHAEEVSDWDLLALINTYIGLVYHNTRELEIALDRYTQSAELNKIIGKKYHEAWCRLHMSRILCSQHKYNEAIEQSKLSLNIYVEQDNKAEMSNMIIGITTILFHNINDAGGALDYYLEHIKEYDLEEDITSYPILSQIYLALDQLEKAEWYCRQFEQNIELSTRQNLFYFLQMRKIQERKGKYKEALEFQDLHNRLHEELVSNNEESRIREIEEKYNNQLLVIKNTNLKRKNLLIAIIAGISILFITTLFLYLLKLRISAIKAKNQKLEDYHLFIEKLKYDNQELENISANLSTKLNEKSILEKELKRSIEKRILDLKELLELASKFEHKPNKFLDNFKASIQSLRKNEYFRDLQLVVDNKYHGFITSIQQEYPNLNKDDLDFISLICLGFDNNEISLMYGHTNSNSVYIKSHRIRNKMKLLNNNKNLKTIFSELLNEVGNSTKRHDCSPQSPM